MRDKFLVLLKFVKSNGEKVGTHCSLNQSSGPGARLKENELYTSDILNLHILSKASEETRASLQHSSSSVLPAFQKLGAGSDSCPATSRN
jgi:hypothetical protein